MSVDARTEISHARCLATARSLTTFENSVENSSSEEISNKHSRRIQNSLENSSEKHQVFGATSQDG